MLKCRSIKVHWMFSVLSVLMLSVVGYAVFFHIDVLVHIKNLAFKFAEFKIDNMIMVYEFILTHKLMLIAIPIILNVIWYFVLDNERIYDYIHPSTADDILGWLLSGGAIMIAIVILLAFGNFIANIVRFVEFVCYKVF